MRNPATVAFAVLGLIWGSNFIFMKRAAETISPGQISLLRVLFGFVPVLIYALYRGDLARHHARYTHHFFVMSVLATSVYYFAFAAGTDRLESGIAGAPERSDPAVLVRRRRDLPARRADHREASRRACSSASRASS